MKKLFACSALGFLILLGCNSENSVKDTNPVKPGGTGDIPQRLLSEIQVDGGTVSFYASGQDVMIHEYSPSGSGPLLGKSLDGLTLSEIHQRLAPGKPVPAELAAFTEPYQVPQQNETSTSEVAPALAKQADMSEAEFRSLHCSWWPYVNSYKYCYPNQNGGTINRMNGYGSRSYFAMVINSDNPIYLIARVNGEHRGSFPSLAKGTHNLSYWSWPNIFNCRPDVWHEYILQHDNTARLHLSLGMNNWCKK